MSETNTTPESLQRPEGLVAYLRLTTVLLVFAALLYGLLMRNQLAPPSRPATPPPAERFPLASLIQAERDRADEVKRRAKETRQQKEQEALARKEAEERQRHAEEERKLIATQQEKTAEELRRERERARREMEARLTRLREQPSDPDTGTSAELPEDPTKNTSSIAAAEGSASSDASAGRASLLSNAESAPDSTAGRESTVSDMIEPELDAVGVINTRPRNAAITESIDASPDATSRAAENAGESASEAEAASIPAPLDLERLKNEEIREPIPGAYLVIYKKQKFMGLVVNNVYVRQYHNIAVPKETEGAKRQDGDGKSPEGTYYICAREIRASGRVLHISYPGPDDAKLALAERRISQAPVTEIEAAWKERAIPPQDTPLGGWIFITGDRDERDFTGGGFAVEPAQFDEVWTATQHGAWVIIQP